MTEIERFYNIYNTPGKRIVLFRELNEILNAEVLKEISGNKDFSISKLAEKIDSHYIDMHDFWQKLLQLRSCLTPEKLVELWFCIISDNGYTDFHKIAVDVPQEEVQQIPPHVKSALEKIWAGYFKRTGNAKPIRTGNWKTIIIKKALNDQKKQLLNYLSLTDELLIDNPAVLNRYCQVQKPGFKMLRYAVNQRRAVKLIIPEKMRQAITADNVEAFLIYKDIAGVKLSYSLLVEIMQNRAARIFDTVIKSKNFFKCTIPIEELAVFCTAQFEDSASTVFLKSIEERFPGTIKNVRDAWGRNLLWYAVYNRRTVFFHPNCKLSEFLLQNGCDPDNMNHLGFSWRYMMKHVETKQKIQLLKLRYRKQSKKNPSHLKEEQPLNMLKDNQFEPEWIKNL